MGEKIPPVLKRVEYNQARCEVRSLPPGVLLGNAITTISPFLSPINARAVSINKPSYHGILDNAQRNVSLKPNLKKPPNFVLVP